MGMRPDSREVAPRFDDGPSEWEAFQRRYFRELHDSPATRRPILEMAPRDTVALLDSAPDRERCNALIRKRYLETQPGNARPECLCVDV